ncbi:hypothetical protein HMPREF3033_01013 [Veillonellaceae bacterium DNF00751]|nr:hypothetical protein HMPREF3033_01013 [Veillonellaceae bacterium DNF00751]
MLSCLFPVSLRPARRYARKISHVQYLYIEFVVPKVAGAKKEIAPDKIRYNIFNCTVKNRCLIHNQYSLMQYKNLLGL